MKQPLKLLLLSTLMCTSPPLLAEEVEVKRNVAEDASIEVSNVAGAISITVWDRAEVHLKGTLGRNQELITSESSRGIEFEVRRTDDDDDYDESYLELVIPSGASVVAEGVSADITIAGAAGESVTAESVSGDVEVNANVARVELSSVSGDVEFEGRAGRGTFESVSGDITASGVSGELSISTVSGDTDLNTGTIERGQFETVSGTLQLTLGLAAGGRVTAEAMSGDVRLTLPAGQEGEFEVETFSGDIRSAFGEVRDESFGPGSRLKHIEGGSGAQFRIESFSGDVSISRR